MGKGKGHIPIRTCISCHKRRAKRDLVRLAVGTCGQLVRDDRGKMKGRGAYICDDPLCMALLSKNKHLDRTFRSQKPITISPTFYDL